MKIDARKVSTAEQQEKRNIAIKLLKKKLIIKEIAEVVGVHVSRIYDWRSKYNKLGKKGLLIGQRGRRSGTKKTLSKGQEQRIIRQLIEKNPQQLQFKFALWTREAVKYLIKYELDIDMPISTVGHYLKKWEFTSKKPIKRAYERKDENTKRWLNEEYPAIKKQAKIEDADIWWGDETACVSLPSNLKGYAPIGSKNKPILTHPAKKFKINMISAITNTGKTMFSLYDESVNVDRFIDFLQKVIDSSDKKVFMIVDNLRVHHAKLVQAWVEEHKKQIAIFYLPPYSPEFNPDEYLNQDYKRNANKNSLPFTLSQLRKNTLNYMNSLVKDTDKVVNFFKHSSIAYAS
ncbi:MAG: Mobile element protein [uncultured Campylobacterales bacterium]|uniref:Mobile element protein n=1 Tax=uncultured Campylobacterales bacterium TaxID=352960 RepID=A0A6S6SWZ1_9BACT|nr:MAG: Mobile element protein [uncultured Campylobacterales bacterium]